MSENDKITEETANDTLPAEVETDLAEQETDVMPAEPEEEEIAPEDVKIFGMPRHVFHWTAIGAAGGFARLYTQDERHRWPALSASSASSCPARSSRPSRAKRMRPSGRSL